MSAYILTTAMDGIDPSVARRLEYICQSIYFYAMYLTGKLWPDSLFPDDTLPKASTMIAHGIYICVFNALPGW